MFCKECGIKMEDEALFCKRCGTKAKSESDYIEKVIFCTKCGTKNADEIKFCYNCGEMLKEDPEPDNNNGEEQPASAEQADAAEQSVPQEIWELWEPIKAEAVKFPFCGAELEIPESMDLFNSYRLKFRELALKRAETVQNEYYAQIRDLTGFMQFFPQIYGYNLKILIQKAIDILITEGLWTITVDSFSERHTADYHLAFDELNVILGGISLKMEANTAFDLIKYGIGAAALQNAANLKPEQQWEMYQYINPQNLFNGVYADYWNIFLSLVEILNKNGQNIWCPPAESEQRRSDDIFQNLSNPNFPQDKILDVLLGMIKSNPYNAQYYKFITSRYGDTEEAAAIRNYFGYTDLTNPIIG